jgi:hypothetical protein
MLRYATHERFARRRETARLSLLTAVARPNDCDQTEIAGNSGPLCLESFKIGSSNGNKAVTEEGLTCPVAH